MQFNKTWEKVLSGEKTQTRRLVKDDEFMARRYTTYIDTSLPVAYLETVLNANNRTVYQVSKTYAVTPARTHPALIYCPDHPCYGIDIIQPGDSHYQLAKEGKWDYRGQGYIQARIRITDIRRQDVRDISQEDARAEGFDNRQAFMFVWLAMHDKPALEPYRTHNLPDGFKSAVLYVRSRPAKFYEAWVLTFEMVK